MKKISPLNFMLIRKLLEIVFRKKQNDLNTNDNALNTNLDSDDIALLGANNALLGTNPDEQGFIA